MKEYAVYWIKEEFAYRYFYKSDILYRFLKTYEKNKYRNDLAQQYDHITKEFSKTSIISHLKLNKQQKVTIESQPNQYRIHRKKQCIYLNVYKKHLTFKCEMIYEAEELLFTTLRFICPFLFIICINEDNYGWISPVKGKNRWTTIVF